MAIDVFISCSTRDRDVAEAIGETLDAHGVSYWSPLALKPGQPTTAPDSFRLVVLVFSSRAAKSRRVVKEVEYALKSTMPIVTLSVDPVGPGPPFDKLAATEYWRDGRRVSLPEHLEQLVYWVTMVLARLDMGARARTTDPRTGRKRLDRTRRAAVTQPMRPSG